MKIGLDIDDVLIDFNRGFLEFFNEKVNRSYALSDIISYEYESIFGMPKEEIEIILDEFTESERHLEVLPVEGALEGLKQLKHHTLYLISARPEKKRASTVAWIKKHLQGLVDVEAMYLTGQYRSEAARTKGELAKEIGIDIFVEDSLKNAYNVAEYGIPVILYNAPWNKTETLPPLITRVHTWKETVENILLLEK